MGSAHCAGFSHNPNGEKIAFRESNYFGKISKRYDALFHTFLSYGFTLIGWYIRTIVLNLTDRYILDYFATSHEVGIYSANFTIAVQALALICNPIFFAFHPLLLNYAEENDDKKMIESRISYFTRIFILIAFPFVAYFSIYRNEISTIILGEEFAMGSMIIPIL